MPRRDSIHYIVKQALINDGWKVTDDPYVISYGKRFLFVDIGAESFPNGIEGRFLGMQRENKKIVVEIKDFRGKSVIEDLEQAIGQYTIYRILLNRIDPAREIYLAVTDVLYDKIFSEPIGKAIISDLPLKLIIVDLETVEIQQWIPPRMIETL
ncbi:MAG TPA: fatty-acid synthase [Thioploca sp.]|nr:MAG: fatty-acid synthase [Beggiatoa sp. 4572_84]RKZ62836.1 MAG: fatty-acid synthase [Gammaproteobacteria bacterium]HDN26879.1 fatty-acid synthase [Thioploca sp.]